MDKTKTDQIGNEFGKDYSLILTDHTFEARLSHFDPSLKLMFDQNKKRWCILQWAPDNSGWVLLLTAQDNEGNPKPLGEWVFNKLYVWRHNYELRKRAPDFFFDELMREEDRQREKIRGKISDANRQIAKEEMVSWRKVANEINNLPISDVTAGYAKITPRNKGIAAKEIRICH